MNDLNYINDMSRQREVLAVANRNRAIALLHLSDGRIDLGELMLRARTTWPELRTIRLSKAYKTQLAAGRPWTDVRSLMFSTLGIEPIDDPKLTIGWVVDPRAGGRRHYAFFDAAHPRTPPWPRFPWGAPDVR